MKRSSDMARGGDRRGFTLIEVLVAIVLAAGIAAAVLVSLSRALRARAVSEARQEAFARAEAAVDGLALDAQNLVRSGDLYDARVLIVDSGGLDLASQHDEALFFVFSSRQARAAGTQNEGGVYEAQYRLESPTDAGASGYTLWRRFDPVPDDVPDGGGVASAVVEGIRSLSIDAFDGRSWFSEWDSDRDGYPHAIRVTALARSGGARPTEAWARRTIAIDRTPAPFATVTTVESGGGR